MPDQPETRDVGKDEGLRRDVASAQKERPKGSKDRRRGIKDNFHDIHVMSTVGGSVVTDRADSIVTALAVIKTQAACPRKRPPVRVGLAMIVTHQWGHRSITVDFVVPIKPPTAPLFRGLTRDDGYQIHAVVQERQSRRELPGHSSPAEWNAGTMMENDGNDLRHSAQFVQMNLTDDAILT
ncbi:hypothetical protein WN51_11065 [Melipona quadrifasciata]|uniref:Uncharacterized protein n=1 Tax=Melipona quadrifasciata TaxID=166423 RepID=A0A0M9A3W6_9HYME|nr:hypothetical protein WN51_11065 [Melipona quadrifasciata]